MPGDEEYDAKEYFEKRERHIALEKVSSNLVLRLSSGINWQPIREMLMLNRISVEHMMRVEDLSNLMLKPPNAIR